MTGTSRVLDRGPTGPFSSLVSKDDYGIECILRERLFGGKRQYLVHWYGYGPSEDCWILLSDMGNAHELLKAWEDERKSLHYSPKCHRDVF